MNVEATKKKVLRTITGHGLIGRSRSVVVGLSGGPDSVCLCHLLATLFPSLGLTGVYVDHLLRPDETGAEKSLAEDLCQRLGAAFQVRTVDVPARVAGTGESVEAAARLLRYRALEEARQAGGAELIAVGHTADDQVEEVLLRLIRGSGLQGLSGMSPKNGRLIRPLLEISKEEVVVYLDFHRLPFCRDSSNLSPRFLRNRIRLELLPLLEREYNPAIRKTILRTAGLLQAEDEFLAAETERLWATLAGADGQDASAAAAISLPSAPLAALHPALRRRLIERLCWRLGCRPDRASITRIEELLADGASGSELHLPGRVRLVKGPETLQGMVLEEGRGPRERLRREVRLYLEIPGPGVYPLPGLDARLTLQRGDGQVVPDAQTLVLDSDRLSFPLVLRALRPGDRFRPLGGPGTRKVARLLSDRKIPAHLRHRYPVLVSGEEIVGVVGLSIDHRCRVRPDTRACLVVRLDAAQP